MLALDPEALSTEAAAVATLLAQHGLDSMIDVHTHFMPQPVMDKVWHYFDQVGPLTGRHWPIGYRHSQEQRIQTLRAFRVQRFTSLVYPHKPDMAEWLNSWATEFAVITPDCLHSATFYPEPGAAKYVPGAIAAGARIFKAHLQVGNYSPNDPLLDPVWGTLEDAGTPVVIHAGNGPAPGQFTGPEGMARLLSRFPHLRLIVAHMGLPEYADFLELCQQYDGVHLDTTMAFTAFTESTHPFPRELLTQLHDLGDRVLFGSDFPNIPYPYLEALEAIVDLGLGADWVRGVLHNNAARLLGLQEL